MSGSRGEANFVWRCKNCKVLEPVSVSGLLRWPNQRPLGQRESSATIKAAPTPYPQTEPAKSHKILEFDCRGLEFTEFLPEVCCTAFGGSIIHGADCIQGEWLVDGVDSNTKFEGVELTEGEWFDYDEKAGDEVSIKDLNWDIVRA